MGVAVIANLVAEGGYGASDGGKPFHVHPADEKGGRGLIPVQDLEQLVGSFTGPIVESKGDRPAPAGAAIHRGGEKSRGSATHRISHPRARRPRQAPQGIATHWRLVSPP